MQLQASALRASFELQTARVLLSKVTPLHVEAMSHAKVKNVLWTHIGDAALAKKRAKAQADLYRWLCIRREVNGMPENNLHKPSRKYKIVRGSKTSINVKIHLTPLGERLLILAVMSAR